MTLPTDPAELVTFFVIGLLGGAHCLGMCGPLVSMYAGKLSGDERTVTVHQVRQHGLFNLGRAASYTVIGGLFGLAGSLVYTAGSVAHTADTLRAVVGIVIGAVIIAIGFFRLIGRNQHGGTFALGAGAFARVTGLVTSRVDRWVDGFGIVALGALHGLLPCPILYPAFLYSFGQGRPLAGALDLAVLGLGTIPTLFVYGTLVESIGTRHRVGLHRVLGAAFVVLGYIPLAHGLNLLGVPVPMIHLPIYSPLKHGGMNM